MKLLHCADLHLDAKMETGLTPSRARERRAELLQGFARMVDDAAAQGVRAVLLAGDVFDHIRVSDRTRRYVGDVIEKHPEMHFLAVTGNHDEAILPLFSEGSGATPDNFTAFSADAWESVTLGDGVVVSGTSDITRPGVWDALPVAEPGVFHIVLLHGQIVRTGEGGGEKIPLSRLKNRGIDYLALGHEHSFVCEKLDGRGLWAYAGCPEGRGFDECGQKGYILLDTDAPMEARVRFIPHGRRTLHLVEVDISDCIRHADVEADVTGALASIAADDMVKVVLTGEISPDAAYDTVQLGTMLNERFYFARVADATRLSLCPADYAADVSLKGEFIRTVLASRMSESDKQRVILCGLRALRGEEVDA